jgi:hypothetical protein
MRIHADPDPDTAPDPKPCIIPNKKETCMKAVSSRTFPLLGEAFRTNLKREKSRYRYCVCSSFTAYKVTPYPGNPADHKVSMFEKF